MKRDQLRAEIFAHAHTATCYISTLLPLLFHFHTRQISLPLFFRCETGRKVYKKVQKWP